MDPLLRRSKRLSEKRAKCTQKSTEEDAREAVKPVNAPRVGGAKRSQRTGAAAGRRADSQTIKAMKKMRPSPELTGLFDKLPTELMDIILDNCTARQLALLETTCRYFSVDRSVQKIAEARLITVPRAKGLTPDRTANERWTSLLHFIMSQSAAAAQATALNFGANHTAALLVPLETKDESREFKHHNLCTWGRGFHGQLGRGDYEPTSKPLELCLGYMPAPVGGVLIVEDLGTMTLEPCINESVGMEEEITGAVVACGMDHTASISRRGQLFTWGLGNSGELGHEEAAFMDRPSPQRALLTARPNMRIVSVACGSNFTLAISENGTLWSSGRNKCGQLGIGSTEDSIQLQRVHGMGRLRVVSAAAGALHSVALASDGTLFTWGDNRYGQLGQYASNPVPPPGLPSPIQRTPAKLQKLAPERLAPHARVTSIASGMWHAMAVTVGGGLLAFGRNTHGQLGTDDQIIRREPNPVVLTFNGGEPSFYRAVQVACGARHSLALVSFKAKLVVCSTGDNYWGQLGLGDKEKRLCFTAVSGLKDPVCVQAGDNNSGAISSDGTMYLWGRNDHGQLGQGDDFTRSQPTVLPYWKAVHPDRTLRKGKRSLPRMRPIKPPQEPKRKGGAIGGVHISYADPTRAAAGAATPGIKGGKPNERCADTFA